MYLNLNEIQSVQIDHTSRCNCLCPQCARVYEGKINPEMPIGELTLEDYKRVFVPELLTNLKQVTQCGNYGDILASDNILECLDWLRSVSDTNITIMTNGSARNEQWWKSLSKILGNKGKVVFSIDGLGDTNHLYRVNSNFNKIIDNARTFISAGGKARWDFLVFNYNEHQVDEARKMAEELGFVEFNVKKTNRFINEKNYQGWVKTELKESVITRKKEYTIEASEKFKTESSSNFDRIIKEHGTWFDYINQTSIDCKFRKQKSIFLDFEGRVWPCTWTASGMYHYGKNTQKDQLMKLFSYYGNNFNSIRSFSMEEILNHEWFKETLIQSWNLRMDSSPVEKLMCCGRTCGEKYDFSSSSESNRNKIVLIPNDGND
jgi:MoaA/NifB/PqqE/SkfB family radical SAM enzyme